MELVIAILYFIIVVISMYYMSNMFQEIEKQTRQTNQNHYILILLIPLFWPVTFIFMRRKYYENKDVE